MPTQADMVPMTTHFSTGWVLQTPSPVCCHDIELQTLSTSKSGQAAHTHTDTHG